MSQHILTQSEAKTLIAIGDESGTRLPEIAVATKLTLSRVRNIIQLLVAKQLVEKNPGDELVRLTKEGSNVVRSLTQLTLGNESQPATASQFKRPGASIRLIPDGGEAPGHPDSTEPDLDRAIDEEVDKLRSR